MSEKKTTTQHRGGPMGGGPGRNIGAKGPKPKTFWGRSNGFSGTCRNAPSLSLPSSF